jgi:hypothetical protein
MTDLSPPVTPGAPARPKARTVLHRLWQTLAVLTGLLGLGISGWGGLAYFHDAPIRVRTLECLQRAQEATKQPDPVAGHWVEVWNPAWIERCHLTPNATEQFAESRDAWEGSWVDLSDGTSGSALSIEWPIILLSWVPFALLVIFRLWIGWMARPEEAR